jgi:hypothetical protein
MTDYRVVMRHVGYWRGNIHKWSTVYPFVGTIPSASYGTALSAIHAMEQAIGYNEPGTHNGGIWESQLYNHSSGGVPIAVVPYFDPTTVGSWIAYTGTAWAGVSQMPNTTLETAMDVRWPAGFSSSGKPVFFRKWYHAVPNNSSGPPVVDVAPANVALIVAQLEAGINIVGGLGAPMGRGGRLAALTPVVAPYFGNHQMPRGRRRKALVTASGRYTGPTIQGEPPVIAD